MKIMIGKTISHYKILEKLGGGGMGVVYKAKDTKLKRTVALKFLPPDLTRDDEAKERFMLEAQAASALDHPNICTIHEIDETKDGQLFIAMACYQGETLKQRLESVGANGRSPLPVAEAIEIVIQIAHGLAKAHEQGIVHRDIKPANIMVTTDGIVKILDFGLAKLTGATQLTKTGTTLGTVAYMSPEQAQGVTVDHRTDIWSLGVVLYEMVSGELPFRGEYEAAVIYSILNEAPEQETAIPANLQQIVAKALAKEPEERYQQMDELLADLNSLKKELESEATKETAAEEKAAPSIAVLPFVDMSPEKDQEYFCDGMAEDLIDTFTKLEGLQVVSRTSAFQFKGKELSIQKIGAELKVNHVLEGSVRKAANRLRITAQLINVADGYHLWSEKYDRELEDVFAIQDDIASTIVNTLKVKLVGEPEVPLIKRYTENLEAYQLYLKGRYFWNKRHQGELQQAMAFFNQTIEKEPTHALAYTGLADSFFIIGHYCYLPPKEAFLKAKAFAQKALEIDDALAEAHTSMAVAKWAYDWDWSAGEQEFRRAIELNPGYATTYWWYAYCLTVLGRTDESFAHIRSAQELDPLSLPINVGVGAINYYARNYDKAVEACLKTLEIEPNFGIAHVILATAYEQQGLFKEARVHLEEAKSVLGPSIAGPSLARSYAVAGQKTKALKVIDAISGATQYVSPYFTATAYTALGDNDQAFDWLQKAFEEKDSQLLFLKVDPKSDNLRSDPRFTELIKKVGLKE
ncbi:MAG: protein kinase [bacterium]